MSRSRKLLREQRRERRDRARPAEQLLIDLLDRFSGTEIFCTTLGRGQLAIACGERWPEANVRCWMLDAYLHERAVNFAEDHESAVDFDCAADPPARALDLALVPCHTGGEAELTRETLQIAYTQLTDGGTLAASVDNPSDVWLRGEMHAMFDKVTTHAAKQGISYVGHKRGPLRKERDFSADFAFRDGETLIWLRTRPGVFSHRRLDGGARALTESMTIHSGRKILDLGCGAGPVGLAAASRTECQVTCLDSNPRAVQCTLQSAEKNGLSDRVSAAVDATGESLPDRTFDLVLANPPYFSNYRIAELFVATSERVLKKSGRLLVVTKHPDWFTERLSRNFRTVTATPQRSYVVVQGEGVIQKRRYGSAR